MVNFAFFGLLKMSLIKVAIWLFYCDIIQFFIHMGLNNYYCLHNYCDIYRLLHRKCDVQIFIHQWQNFGKRTSERSERVSFPKFCNEWIKICTKHFLWCNLFIIYKARIKHDHQISFISIWNLMSLLAKTVKFHNCSPETRRKRVHINNYSQSKITENTGRLLQCIEQNLCFLITIWFNEVMLTLRAVQRQVRTLLA